MFGRILRRPFVWLVVLVVLPQLAASAVNIAYNLTQIVAEMNDAQKEKFYQTFKHLQRFVYPIAILAFVFVVLADRTMLEVALECRAIERRRSESGSPAGFTNTALYRRADGLRLVSRRVYFSVRDLDDDGLENDARLAFRGFIRSFRNDRAGVFVVRRGVRRLARSLSGPVARCTAFYCRSTRGACCPSNCI